MKTFCFTVDDNIIFLRDLTIDTYNSLFDHPYLALYKKLHERFDLKIQLNLFYETNAFDLSQMSDRYRREWEENADWLKLSFHSRGEMPRRPYERADHTEVAQDCIAVQNEILRFAGKLSLGETTTIHYCATTADGNRALYDNGIRGLLGLFDTDENPRISYSLPTEICAKIRHGQPVTEQGIAFYPLDIVLNLFEPDEILQKLEVLSERQHLNVMIHEQYFYPFYPAYQPNFAEKLEKTFVWMEQHQYTSQFLENVI